MRMPIGLKILLWILLLVGEGAANAAPSIELGTPNNYCVVYCYIRVPFTIVNYDVTHKIGRVFCDFDAEVTAQLPIYNGDVELSTGILKKYFVGANVKSIHCHL